MVIELPRGPVPRAKVGPFTATLVNGVFGDPLLHLRVAERKRSLLVDLGEGIRIAARTAHQVTDLFLSHAHIDHIAGFLTFLRSRIGHWPTCRVFGPPGIAANIAGLIAGVLWDRAAQRAPRFDVTEFDGAQRRRFVLEAGAGVSAPGGAEHAEQGLLHSDECVRVHAVLLDHKTPVVAYAFHTHRTLNVRKERLLALGVRPGPWLTQLKDAIAQGRSDALIRLTDGTSSQAGRLAEDLLIEAPGQKLVYATDFADTPENRRAVIALAEGAHTLFCEAPFREADVAQARRTGHLTTRACGEIGSAARVGRLVPFHFSRRYESDPRSVYEEVRAACPATVVPELAGGNANAHAE